uniref:DDE Tnp4 domain-containing protein n=1 Tax=Amazona collaria TaxID=241587 RepID=A0A8B9G468_9PSIT
MAAPIAGLCLWLLLRLRRFRRLRGASLGLRRCRSRRARRRLTALRLYGSLLLGAPAPGRVWSLRRNSAFWDTVRDKALSAPEWAERFRVRPETFDFVFGRLRSAIERRDTVMRRAVPADVRLALTLCRLGACTGYRALEQRFGVSRSTVCKVLRDVCAAAVAILGPAFAAPPSVASGFALPQLCGVLSRLRVPIRAPSDAASAARYRDGRGWHSVELQAAVDASGCFWAIEVRAPGADVRRSALFRRAQRGGICAAPPLVLNGVSVPPFLLGRARDPLLPWLLRPFRACGTEGRRRFNAAAAEAAAAARAALGGLRGRWRCLQRRNDADVAALPALLGACCVLHNVCERRG